MAGVELEKEWLHLRNPRATPPTDRRGPRPVLWPASPMSAQALMLRDDQGGGRDWIIPLDEVS